MRWINAQKRLPKLPRGGRVWIESEKGRDFAVRCLVRGREHTAEALYWFVAAKFECEDINPQHITHWAHMGKAWERGMLKSACGGIVSICKNRIVEEAFYFANICLAFMNALGGAVWGNRPLLVFGCVCFGLFAAVHKKRFA